MKNINKFISQVHCVIVNPFHIKLMIIFGSQRFLSTTPSKVNRKVQAAQRINSISMNKSGQVQSEE